MAARATPVEEVKTEDVERLCQAVSPNDEPCDFPATVHCAKCADGSAMLMPRTRVACVYAAAW